MGLSEFWGAKYREEDQGGIDCRRRLDEVLSENQRLSEIIKTSLRTIQKNLDEGRIQEDKYPEDAWGRVELYESALGLVQSILGNAVIADDFTTNLKSKND